MELFMNDHLNWSFVRRKTLFDDLVYAIFCGFHRNLQISKSESLNPLEFMDFDT